MFQIDLTSYQSMSSMAWVAILVMSGVFLRLFMMLKKVTQEDDKRQREQAAQEKVTQLILDQFKTEQDERRHQQRSMEVRMNKMADQNTLLQREISRLHGDSRACAAENMVLREEVAHLRAQNNALRDELARTNNRLDHVATSAGPAAG